jgi:hypothetical protein
VNVNQRIIVFELLSNLWIIVNCQVSKIAVCGMLTIDSSVVTDEISRCTTTNTMLAVNPGCFIWLAVIVVALMIIVGFVVLRFVWV